MRIASAIVAVVFASTAVSSCKSKPDVRDEKEEEVDLLDQPVEGSSSSTAAEPAEPSASFTPTTMLLPDTPEKPSREIDGKVDDWDTGKFRAFTDEAMIEDGAAFWSGDTDGAFRVGVDADGGFVYFLIQVRDDEIIDTEPGQEPVDGVVLHLRDPGLDSLAKALPDSVDLDQYVDAETAILFYPSARIVSYDGDALPFDDIMFHEVDRGDGGYTVEVAIKLEAFQEVSAIPLPEIAFRVEILDGDESDRRGTQTVLSTMPTIEKDNPRMSVYTVGGLLPHADIANEPPRANAIGRWKYEEEKWNFVSFEIVPKYWVTLGDPTAFQEALEKADILQDVCQVARKDIHLIETYQSRGGGFRAGLVLCGQRAVGGRCPADAETNLFWVALEPVDDSWVVDRAINVFEEPLNQCTYQRAGPDPFYQYFSLFPLDVMGSSIWAIGWDRTVDASEADESTSGVTFLNTKYKNPHIGDVVIEQRQSYPGERILQNSSVYLTLVDDDDNVDICQFETVIEQKCEGIDRGCVTPDRGRLTLTHVQMWSPKQKRFERYELSKHRNCSSATFDFSERPGYLLLQVKGRVGLLPSPKSNEEEEESLDLF